MSHLLLSEREKKAKRLTTIIYALYAASFFFGITALVAILLNYIKADEVRGTFCESHFDWQKSTFWRTLIWGIIGSVLLIILIGWLVLAVLSVWVIYRIIIGYLKLHDDQPIH